MKKVVLSDEQQLFVSEAKKGKNILVDACIGSGKTTAIQRLCDELPQDKNILYLTYNKLLKIDAKSKIKNSNVTVNNYHGYAYNELKKAKIQAGIPDLIQTFNAVKPDIEKFDVLIIDEYQDIEQELAAMLIFIKSKNPKMQIIAVGDAEQKIYDKTTLKARPFIDFFLGKHETLEFTNCFRLNAAHAAMLGRVWGKTINGVNENCKTQTMTLDEAVEFLSRQKTKDILCLGSKNGAATDAFNRLCAEYPEKFNKFNTYARISDGISDGATQPTPTSAIFTTFDSSKGLERKICVVFDFTESYWAVRMAKPQQSYEILRNIFCVAASRGKERIIFVDQNEEMLSENTLSCNFSANVIFDDVDISAMFDFKFREDIERCFSCLEIKRREVDDKSEIAVKNHDGLIDLSPCVGIYQEAVYFNGYDIDREISQYFLLHPNVKFLYTDRQKNLSLDKKILFLVSMDTGHERYRTQVATPFVPPARKREITARLATLLNKDEAVQSPCSIDFADPSGRKIFSARGLADAVKDGVVYELKFVSELSHEHFLQCASYAVALEAKAGILWNTRNNAIFEIQIPDRRRFLDCVAIAVTKGYLDGYYPPL